MAKRVLYLSYDGMTDPLGQSQVIPYLKTLATLGHSITIVSAEKKQAFAKRKKEVDQQLLVSAIQWYSVKFSNRIPGWSAWVNYLRLKSKARRQLRKQKFDIIHCRSYIPAIIGEELKKKFGGKIIFDMRGFWADERVEGGLWNLKNPVYRMTYDFFKRKEKELLEKSDAIISLTKKAKDELLGWQELKIPEGKITVIPCCVDLELFSQNRINSGRLTEWKKKLEISENDFILSYSGSLGTWYMMNEMLEFFRLLLQYKAGSKFLFITFEKKEKIIRAAQQAGIPQEKIIVVSAFRNEMPELLSLSHVSIFFIKKSFSKKASSPTKMAEAMALGIPLICNAGVGDLKEMIDQTGAGAIVENFDKTELNRVAMQINEIASVSGEKIRKSAEEIFSLQKGVQLYNQIYSSL